MNNIYFIGVLIEEVEELFQTTSTYRNPVLFESCNDIYLNIGEIVLPKRLSELDKINNKYYKLRFNPSLNFSRLLDDNIKFKTVTDANIFSCELKYIGRELMFKEA